MRNMRFDILSIVGLLAAVAVPARGQVSDSARKAAPRIIGIFDSRTGEPLRAVQVRDLFSGDYVVTTVTGSARLDFLTFKGTAAMIELRKLGYRAKELVLDHRDTVAITELLEPAVTLAPVVTTESYRIDRDAGKWEGLAERCRSKSVTCIGGEELEKMPSANLADFLIRADGVTIGACGAGRRAQCGRIAMRSPVIPPSYCQPTFFVDGYEWDSHMSPPTDLTPHKPAQGPYTPGNVKAVEVYPPERPRPLRFEGDPACGAVVIWTK
jgi:hypothetical protein